jgi:hypothetical protein
MLGAQDHDIQLALSPSMMPLRLMRSFPPFCTMVKHEKVLNGKIWKKIPMEFEGICVTQQTKPF